MTERLFSISRNNEIIPGFNAWFFLALQFISVIRYNIHRRKGERKMRCPNCHQQLKVNRIIKQADCESCDRQYQFRYRRINLLAWLLLILLISSVLAKCLGYFLAVWPAYYPLILILFNLALYFIMPREWIDKFIYQLIEKEK